MLQCTSSRSTYKDHLRVNSSKNPPQFEAGARVEIIGWAGVHSELKFLGYMDFL